MPKKKAVAKRIAKARTRKEIGDQGPPVELAIGLQPFQLAPPVEYANPFMKNVVKSAALYDMGYTITRDMRNDRLYITSADALTLDGKDIHWRAE